MSEEKPESAKLAKPGLGPYDALGIVSSWTGAVIMTAVTQDAIIAIISIASAYYLSKWIILKKD